MAAQGRVPRIEGEARRPVEHIMHENRPRVMRPQVVGLTTQAELLASPREPIPAGCNLAPQADGLERRGHPPVGQKVCVRHQAALCKCRAAWRHDSLPSTPSHPCAHTGVGARWPVIGASLDQIVAARALDQLCIGSFGGIPMAAELRKGDLFWKEIEHPDRLECNHVQPQCQCKLIGMRMALRVL